MLVILYNSMTREEKCKLAIEKGFTYDETTGKIYGVRGKEIIRKVKGYIDISFRFYKKQYHLLGHQFAYYYKYCKIVDCIDHINCIKDDNRICNLRSITKQQNEFNTKSKGYCFDKCRNKFLATIGLNNKIIYLGRYNTEQEARQAYLEGKEKYHKI